MAQSPNVPLPEPAPEENKRATLIRSIGIAIFVLILWFVDRLTARRLSERSVWRYIIGGTIISAGLVALLAFTSRFARKDS